MNCLTPHISAAKGQIAKTVIMPGDPLRAKMIAKRFLKDSRLVSSVRNNLCFTGTYKGREITIMSSGMGCASMGIYAYELFKFFDVENIIRVGTIGSLQKDIKIKDIIVAKNAITDTNFNHFFAKKGEAETKCSKKLLEVFKETVAEQNLEVRIGTVFTTDTFYDLEKNNRRIASSGVLGIEMECAALYLTANKLGKQALTVCTVSDEIFSNLECSWEKRQKGFIKMITLAIDTAAKL